MKQVIVKDGQNIYDIALQVYGEVDAVNTLYAYNPAIEGLIELAPGTRIDIPVQQITATIDDDIRNEGYVMPQAQQQSTPSGEGTMKHDDLQNRELPGQHPATAINVDVTALTDKSVTDVQKLAEKVDVFVEWVNQQFLSINQQIFSLWEALAALWQPTTDGDGTKFLADDGTYKEITTGIDGIVSGGVVVWSEQGLTFYLLPTQWRFTNQLFTTQDKTALTLSDAHPTLGRFDTIFLGSEGEVGVIAGTAASDPVIPTINPGSQIFVTSIYVGAGAVTPDISNLIIYEENTEWAASANFAGANFSSTANPAKGAKHIRISNILHNNTITFLGFSVDTYQTLQFRIYLHAPMQSIESLRIILMDGTLSSNIITAPVVKDLTGTYQVIAVSLKSFNLAKFDRVLLRWYRSTLRTEAYGMFDLDSVRLEGGIVPPANTDTVPEAPNDDQVYVRGSQSWIAGVSKAAFLALVQTYEDFVIWTGEQLTVLGQALTNHIESKVHVPDPTDQPDGKILETQEGELVYVDKPSGGGSGGHILQTPTGTDLAARAKFRSESGIVFENKPDVDYSSAKIDSTVKLGDGQAGGIRTIEASGTEANIDLELKTKGAGKVKSNALSGIGERVATVNAGGELSATKGMTNLVLVDVELSMYLAEENNWVNNVCSIPNTVTFSRGVAGNQMFNRQNNMEYVCDGLSGSNVLWYRSPWAKETSPLFVYRSTDNATDYDNIINSANYDLSGKYTGPYITTISVGRIIINGDFTYFIINELNDTVFRIKRHI
jgi:hypothetical protein